MSQPGLISAETYEFMMATFEHIQPEELLMLLNNLKTAVDGTGTVTVAGKINYLCKILCGEALQEFNELTSHNSGMENSHLKHIQEGLLGYFFPINSLSKKKRVMRRAIRKPWNLPLRRFSAQLTEVNNYLPLFPGSSNNNKIPPE